MSVAGSTPPRLSPLRNELIGLLTCPDDGAALRGWDGATGEGALTCPACGEAFPVEGGVPRLLPEALRGAHPAEEMGSEFARKRQEMAARDAQVTLYDRNLPLRL